MPEIDFLQAISIPTHESVTFVKGFDGYPAFEFGKKANERKLSRLYLNKIDEEFSILVTTRPNTKEGGFLFAIVDPLETVVQLGVRLSKADGDGETNIMLYVTDHRTSSSSTVIAKFTVPSFVQKWTRFALQVRQAVVTLFLDCQEYDSVMYKRVKGEIPIEQSSTLFVGQGGDVIGNKYEVGDWSQRGDHNIFIGDLKLHPHYTTTLPGGL